MNYTYEFLKIHPKDLWVQVKYSVDDSSLPDIIKNIITDNFTEEGLNAKAIQVGEGVVSQWEKIALAPVEVNLTETVKQAVYKPTTVSPPPKYDPYTQKLVSIESETETEILQEWVAIEMTEAEKTAFIEEWRSSSQVSMRQARLALIQQNLLQTVNEQIQQLEEPNKSIVETEWEYSAVVDRNSEWVAVMASAMGLSDEQMDDLFKLAKTL